MGGISQACKPCSCPASRPKKEPRVVPSLSYTAHCFFFVVYHMAGQLGRQVVGARNSDFIQKARRPKRWWTTVPKNYLCWVRIRVSFTQKICVASLQIWTYCSCWVPELKSSEKTYSEKGKGFATTTESGKYGSTMFLSCDFWVRSLPHTLHCCVFSPG